MTEKQIKARLKKILITVYLVAAIYLAVSIAIVSVLGKTLYLIQISFLPVAIIAVGGLPLVNLYADGLYNKEIFTPYLQSKGIEFQHKSAKQHITIDELTKPLMFSKNSTRYKFVPRNMLTINKDISFRSSDIDYYYVVSSGKSSQKVTVFNGRMYLIDYPKYKDLWLVVREEGNILKNKPNQLHQIEFEASDFNKKFNVYANDELESFIAIRPQVIEKIIALEQSFEGTLHLAIKDGVLYFGRNDKKQSLKLTRHTKLEEIDEKINEELDLVKEITSIFN